MTFETLETILHEVGENAFKLAWLRQPFQWRCENSGKYNVLMGHAEPYWQPDIKVWRACK